MVAGSLHVPVRISLCRRSGPTIRHIGEAPG
jgi:hypothetical protein